MATMLPRDGAVAAKLADLERKAIDRALLKGGAQTKAKIEAREAKKRRLTRERVRRYRASGNAKKPVLAPGYQNPGSGEIDPSKSRRNPRVFGRSKRPSVTFDPSVGAIA